MAPSAEAVAAIAEDPPPVGAATLRPRRSKAAGPRGRKLFAFDRQFERRFVAGADEAGRG